MNVHQYIALSQFDFTVHGFQEHAAASIAYWAERSSRENLTIRLPDDTLLTQRTIKLLQLVLMGTPRAQIADELCVSLKTVEKHITQLTERMAVFAPDQPNLLGSLNAMGLSCFLLASLQYKVYLKSRGIPTRW